MCGREATSLAVGIELLILQISEKVPLQFLNDNSKSMRNKSGEIEERSSCFDT